MGFKRDILIGLGVVAALLLIVGIFIGLLIILTKAIGLLAILGGIFLIVFFPDISEAQPHEMSLTAFFMGLILIIAGILLIVF